MKRKAQLRSFSVYFADKEQLEKAISIAESDRWQIEWEEGSFDNYTVADFWFSDMTPKRIQEFLDEINAND